MVNDFVFKDSYGFGDLLEIMRLLRSKDGCQWDREQNHLSIKNNLIEECYEVVDALERDDSISLQEELGDLLMQIVFHALMEEENHSFDINDVCDGLCKKLIHRHPHVFGKVSVSGTDEILSNWDRIKQEEKKQETFSSTLDAVPKCFPALMRAQKVQKRSAKSGFDYKDPEDAFNDARSEIEEFHEAVNGNGNPMEEIGDLLFSAVNLARIYKIDAEEALQLSTNKFVKRFTYVEKQANLEHIELSDCDMDKLNLLWNNSKIICGGKDS